MSEMNYDDMATFLVNIIRQLALIPTEELRAHIEHSDASVSYSDSIGAILDPTGYRNALQTGQFEDARFQSQMVRKLLEIRELVDKREAFVAKKRGQS